MKDYLKDEMLEDNTFDNGFSFGDISGLGSSDYENEDLFDTGNENLNSEYNDANIYNFNFDNTIGNEMYDIPFISNESSHSVEEIANKGFEMEEPDQFTEVEEAPNEGFEIGGQDQFTEVEEVSNEEFKTEEQDQFTEVEEVPNEEFETGEQIQIDEMNEEYLDNEPEFMDTNLESQNEEFLNLIEENPEPEEQVQSEEKSEEIEPEIQSDDLFSDTPIEEINKLTEYEKENIESTDIKSLFDRVGVNVKEASDIFRKNTEMKEKIDVRFEQLKKLQSEIKTSKQNQIDEINAYKEEVLAKLTEKKEEIEKRLNKLKEIQSSLEKEKQEFEQYKKSTTEEIERVQKEVQEAYDIRREELGHVEDVLRKQKDALDEERNQLSLDIIQYEADKNELANNLLKFNEIVDSFTNGMDKIDKE